MRISDWSSDVCSSDLLQAHLARHRDGGDGVQRVVASEHRQVQAIQARGMGAAAVGQLDIEGEAAVVDADVLGAVEVGRASWRERVCEYVSISVVAVTLKKIQNVNDLKVGVQVE